MASGIRRRLGRRALVVLLAFTMAVLGAEALLRWTPLGERIYYRAPIYVGERVTRPSKAFAPDPHTGWRMQPGARFNFLTEGREVEYLAGEDGYRTGPGRAAGEGARSIALIGDSFAWGFGVTWEESCAALLEAQVDDCRVHVLAMPGFGLDQMMESARHRALPLEPDLVVVAIFSDDLSRCFTGYREKEGFNKPLFRLDGAELFRRSAEDRPGRLRLYLERESELFAAFWNVRRVIGKRHGVGGWWALNAAFLDRIVADLDAASIPVLFIHIPKRNGTPIPALNEHMRANGAAFVDLIDRAPKPLDDLYFVKDDHFSPRGHRFLAQVVREWIDTNLPSMK